MEARAAHLPLKDVRSGRSAMEAAKTLTPGTLLTIPGCTGTGKKKEMETYRNGVAYAESAEANDLLLYRLITAPTLRPV